MRTTLLKPSATPIALRCLAALLYLSAAPGAQAQALSYPGATPCDTTLQACIDGANSGDSIWLNSNSYIAEDVVIEKNLTLMPQPASGIQPSVRRITARATTNDVRVVVIGLTSLGGASRVRGVLGSGGGNLSLTVNDSKLTGRNYDAALELTASTVPGTYGQAYGTFNRNTVHQTGSAGVCAPGIAAYAFWPGMVAIAAGNTVIANDLGQCAAMQFVASGARTPITLQVFARKNIVQARNLTGGGISLRSALGALSARVADTLVTGQDSNVGLMVLADGRDATAQVQVTNNTVTGHAYGAHVAARTDLFANVTGVMANNLFAHNPAFGLNVDPGLPGFTEHHNLFHASRAPQPASPGTRVGNPSFVNAAGGDYRLRADSDAIDRGEDAVVYSPDNLDLANLTRNVRTVDIGAYEFQGTPMAPSPTPVPALGTAALAASAALLALLAAARLRRRG